MTVSEDRIPTHLVSAFSLSPYDAHLFSCIESSCICLLSRFHTSFSRRGIFDGLASRLDPTGADPAELRQDSVVPVRLRPSRGYRTPLCRPLFCLLSIPQYLCEMSGDCAVPGVIVGFAVREVQVRSVGARSAPV